MKNYELLESTGYSYSGISDIVNNDFEKSEELLCLIDDRYNEIKEKQAELEKQLELLKNERGMLVSSFFYFHLASKLGDKPLSFIKDDCFVNIEILDTNTHKIDYTKKPINFILKNARD